MFLRVRLRDSTRQAASADDRGEQFACVGIMLERSLRRPIGRHNRRFAIARGMPRALKGVGQRSARLTRRKGTARLVRRHPMRERDVKATPGDPRGQVPTDRHLDAVLEVVPVVSLRHNVTCAGVPRFRSSG